jgi:hypothetical protein
MSGADLLKASERGDLAEVNRLLSEGADANHKNDVCDVYVYANNTVMHCIIFIITLIVFIIYNRKLIPH